MADLPLTKHQLPTDTLYTNSALGTPASGNLANCTGYPTGGLGGLTYNTEESQSLGGSAGGDDYGITASKFFEIFTLPTTYPFYVITGIEWYNGAAVAGNVISGVALVDAYPPVSPNTISVARGAVVAQSGTNAVQRQSSIISGLIPGGFICGAWFISSIGNTTSKFKYVAAASQNRYKITTYAAEATLIPFDTIAWGVTTTSHYIKVYYKGVKNA